MSASSVSSQYRPACRGRRPSARTAMRHTSPGCVGGQRPAADAELVQRHAVRVQQPGHVVVRGDQQRGRVRERHVVGQPLRAHVAVRGDDRQVPHRVVEPPGDVAGGRDRRAAAGPGASVSGASCHRRWSAPARRRGNRLPHVAAAPLPGARQQVQGGRMTHTARPRPASRGRPADRGRDDRARRGPGHAVRRGAARRGRPRRAQRLRAGARRRPGPARCRCCCARCTARCTGASAG